MSAYLFRSIGPNNWVLPRQNMDENQRRKTYGPIQPMEPIGLLGRLMGRH